MAAQALETTPRDQLEELVPPMHSHMAILFQILEPIDEIDIVLVVSDRVGDDQAAGILQYSSNLPQGDRRLGEVVKGVAADDAVEYNLGFPTTNRCVRRKTW